MVQSNFRFRTNNENAVVETPTPCRKKKHTTTADSYYSIQDS